MRLAHHQREQQSNVYAEENTNQQHKLSNQSANVVLVCSVFHERVSGQCCIASTSAVNSTDEEVHYRPAYPPLQLSTYALV